MYHLSEALEVSHLTCTCVCVCVFVCAQERTERPFVGLPDGALLNFVSWSPKGLRVAFTVRSSGEPGSAPRGPLALWVAEVDTMQCRRLLDDTMRLNTVFEVRRRLLCTASPPPLPSLHHLRADRRAVSARSRLPKRTYRFPLGEPHYNALSAPWSPTPSLHHSHPLSTSSDRR